MDRCLKSLSRFGVILLIGLFLPTTNAFAGSGDCSVVDAGTWIEAENYTTAGSEFTDMGTYLDADNKDTVFAPPSGETPVGYELYFPAAGTYYIFVRGNSNGSNSNDSIWYGIDGDPVGGIDFPGDNNYNWTNTRFSHGPTPPIVTLASAGTHTINFWSRELDLKLMLF